MVNYTGTDLNYAVVNFSTNINIKILVIRTGPVDTRMAVDSKLLPPTSADLPGKAKVVSLNVLYLKKNDEVIQPVEGVSDVSDLLSDGMPNAV